jgi:tripartite-type tricarboxylate transporter receptor subunit TctC
MFNRRTVLALVAAAVALPAAVGAAPVTDLHLLRLISGLSAGSSGDRMLRAIGSALQRLLPEAHIEVENGSGDIRTLEEVSATTSPDPTVLALVAGGVLYEILLGKSDAPSRLAGVSLVGAIGRSSRALYVSKQSGITSIDGLLATKVPLFIPTSSVKASSYIEALIVNALIGSRLKPVPGYATAERTTALMSGEANAELGSVDSFSDLVDQGILIPLMRITDGPMAPPYADLVTLGSLAKGPDAPALVGLMNSVADANRILLAPASAPPAALAALRTLFGTIVADPQFAKQSGLGSSIDASDHTELEASVGKVLAQQATLGRMLGRALACGDALSNGATCS